MLAIIFYILYTIANLILSDEDSYSDVVVCLPCSHVVAKTAQCTAT